LLQQLLTGDKKITLILKKRMLMKIYSYLIFGILTLSVAGNLLANDSCPCTRREPCCLENKKSCACCCFNRDDKTGHSFMFTRPLNQQTSTFQTLWHNIVYEKSAEKKSGLQIIGAYQQSIPCDADKRYFLLDCKHELFVSGDNNTTDLTTRDIRAEWLGLPGNFKGNFTICPQQKQGGIILEYNHSLASLTDSDFFNGLWIGIIAPLITIENRTNLTQYDIKNTSTATPTDLTQAFCQKDWMYGKFCNRPQKSTQLAELRLAFGHAFVAENNFLFASYTHLSIPTVNAQCAEFLFNAAPGNNGHLGIGGGVNIQFVTNRENSSPFDFCFFLNLDATFFARDTQHRTFDLIKKPWSRYLLLIHKDNPSRVIPGVNVLTREVRVRPYGFADFSTGLRIKNEHIEFELGYNLWGHTAERLELLCPFPHGYGIQGSTAAVTASGSTIKTLTANDSSFVEITESDLNMNSAAAQSVITHKMHLSLGLTRETEKVASFAGVGAFYELPQRNGALKLWGIWAKFGLGF
jgi:hypothetical protein